VATFGYTGDGDTAGETTANRQDGSKYTLSENGTVTSITVYVDPTDTKKLRACIYDDDGSSSLPNTLMGYSDERTFGAGDGLAHYTFTFSTPCALTAGDWWLMLHANAGSQPYYYLVGVSGKPRAWFNDTYSDGPLATATGAGQSATRNFCIYATYTPATGNPHYAYAQQ
jgi:hypothetical protein